MSWFKVDDGFHSHPKAMRAGTSALGLWARCGSWSAQQLTEGFIPKSVVEMYGTRAQVRRLLDAELWREVEGGYQFHDWTDKNPTREQVLCERAAAADRQRRGRAAARKRRESEQSPNGRQAPSRRDSAVTDSVSHRPVTTPRPDPTRRVLSEPLEPTPTESAHGTAQTLLGEWIDHCQAPPVGRVKGQVARLLGELLAEGQPYDVVRAGLARWHDARKHPSTLPSFVHEVAQGPRRPEGDGLSESARGHLALVEKFSTHPTGEITA